ncbi:hypothetical protein [Microbulbifer yueqingensis]|uniref:hypothetical protein n=1 Tax=Microbulbifer yueqingensis TaxID=658219 RepID=UPI000B879DC0|nr:hypothetical protein [Microbulbifer yueqingensis]
MGYWLAEVLLSLAALLVASQYWYLTRERCQSPALLVVAALLPLALAAATGAYRYTIDPGVTGWHRVFSALSAQLTFPLVGVALAWVYLLPERGVDSRAPAYGVLTLATGAAVYLIATDSSRFPVAGIGLALWLGVALAAAFRRRLSPPAATLLSLGPLLVVFASLAVGTGATRLLGIARMNWFHLLLAIAVLTLLCARPLFGEGKEGNGR